MPDLSGPGRYSAFKRDQVVEALGLGLAQELAHPRAFKLEDPECGAFAEHLVGLRIVERDGIDIDRDAFGALDLGEAVLDERQRAQPEEVHLQEADALDLLHVPLRRDFVPRPLVERRVVGDRTWCDHHAGGVDRRMARHAFEALADVDDFLDLGVLRHHVLEDRVLGERLLERHVERRRDLLRDPIDIGIRHVERASDVPHDGLRLHRPEGDDLRDVLAAVLPRDVVDHFAAAPLAEVHVDIGQRHALGVQEALEDEIELERIDVGDAHAPRHERAGCRSSSRSNRNTFLTRVTDEVPDDEEVPRVPHLVDHLDLVLEATGVLVDRLTKPSGRGELLQARHPLCEALARHVLEVLRRA